VSGERGFLISRFKILGQPSRSHSRNLVATGLWPVNLAAFFHARETAHRAVATAATVHLTRFGAENRFERKVWIEMI